MERAIEEYRAATEPYYLAVSREIELFEAANAARLPVMLKGPTGSGKTRFVEHMAWRLERPLITVACHEDLSATDLVGRFLLEGQETVWHDGPLTKAVRNGAICYLDEVVEDGVTQLDGDPDAAVGDGELDHATGGLGVDGDLPAIGRVLHRVVDEGIE